MKSKVLKVHPKDNVLVALTNLTRGETIWFEAEDYLLQEDIPAKHKFFSSHHSPNSVAAPCHAAYGRRGQET